MCKNVHGMIDIMVIAIIIELEKKHFLGEQNAFA